MKSTCPIDGVTPFSHEHESKWSSDRANERSEASIVEQANEWVMGANERTDEQMAKNSFITFNPLFSIQQIQNKVNFLSITMGWGTLFFRSNHVWVGQRFISFHNRYHLDLDLSISLWHFSCWGQHKTAAAAHVHLRRTWTYNNNNNNNNNKQ